MEELGKNNPLRKELIGLIVSIAEEVEMSEQNQVFLLHKLNTEEKVFLFNDWIKSKLESGKLQVTEAEICQKAVQIAKQF